MTQGNQQLTRGLGLLGTICGSLLMGLPTFAQIDFNSSPVEPFPSDNERRLPTLPSAVPQLPGDSSDRISPPRPSTQPPAPISSDRISPPRPSTQPPAPISSDRISPPRPSTQPPAPISSDRISPPRPSTQPPAPISSDRISPPRPSTQPPAPISSDRISPPRQSVIFEAPPSSTSTSSPLPRTVPQPARDSFSLYPPPPEQLELPSATITPMNGMVNLNLVNQTGAAIDYQVLGDTNQRSLQPRSNVTLQTLKAPVNITFERPDGGLIRVSPQASSQPGMLTVIFTETTDLDADKKAMTVQETGDVFLN